MEYYPMRFEDEIDDEEVDDISIELREKSGAFLRQVINGRYEWDTDPNLLKTPQRFARMLRELTTPEDFDFTVFPNTNPRSEMIIVKDIEFVALCSHHIIPFVGKAWIGYIPDEKIAGLSKFARAVRFWSRGLWSQEDLTHSISAYLEDLLGPLGIAIVMEAEHMCMTIRGVQAPGTKTITSSMRGVFLDPPKGRDPKFEFLTLIQRSL